jgi:hypothetical protein
MPASLPDPALQAGPPPPDGPGDDGEGAAVRAVGVLVRELNELLDPIVDQLEMDLSADS